MKKFILFLSAVVSSTLPVFAKENKNSNKRFNFELMEPVRLKNPRNINWGLESGGPKYTVYKKVAPIAIKEDVVVEPVVILPTPVKEEPVVVEEKTVVDVKQENVVVNTSESVSELKEDAPVVEKEQKELSQTDKNIEEAKKLLTVAEKLANSVIEEEEPAVITPKEEVKKPSVVVDTEKPKFTIKFAKNAEELKKSDEKKIADLIPSVKANEDVIVKIISYYSSNSGRNIAFSRLLNARKILLEKDVPTSQIMIMVLEDEDQNTSKDNTLELFIVR